MELIGTVILALIAIPVVILMVVVIFGQPPKKGTDKEELKARAKVLCEVRANDIKAHQWLSQDEAETDFMTMALGSHHYTLVSECYGTVRYIVVSPMMTGQPTEDITLDIDWWSIVHKDTINP